MQTGSSVKQAWEALWKLPADELVKVIVLLLRDQRGDVRASACRTLRKLPVNELVKLTDYMVPLLKDADERVRSSAWETLGKLPTDELVKVKDQIVPFLKDAKEDVRARACQTSGLLATDELVTFLTDASEDVRSSACQTLCQLRMDELVQLKGQLFAILETQDYQVHSSVYQILEKLPADELVEVIVLLLRDQRGDVRASACKLSGKLPVNELVKLTDYMVPLLKDADERVRSSAWETLGKLPTDELVKVKDQIVPFLKDAKEDVRARACQTSGLLATDELVTFLTDASEDVRSSACQTLCQLRMDELVQLKGQLFAILETQDHQVYSSVYQILEKFPAGELVKVIVFLLRDQRGDVRASACKLSGKLPVNELVKLKHRLVSLLNDPSEDVRSSARQTLGRLPADELIEVIVPLLRDRCGDVRASACQTLGKLPVNELVKSKDYIVPLLKDSTARVCSSAWEVLGRFPTDEVVKLQDMIVWLLNDTHLHVRAKAFALFGRLELTKDLISLVEKFRKAFLLHFAAAAGDWSACVLLVRCGFSLEEKDRDGKTPSEIACKEGHSDLAGRLKSDFLNTKGGSGLAIARALQDHNQIEAVSWYTMPLSGWARHFGGQHSVLLVKAKDFAYAIERARPVHEDLLSQKSDIKQATKKGLFVSDWEEVRTVPHLVQLETVALLQGSDVKSRISPRSLVTYLLSFGGYHVGSNNCHHTAMHAYNFCSERRQLTSLPVNSWQSSAAKVFRPFGSHSASGRSASGSRSEPLYSDVIRDPLITGSTPIEWTSDGQTKPYLQKVDRESMQYQKVKDFVMKFGGGEIPGFEIQKIHRNENFGSYEKYFLNLKDKTAQHEYCWLFHGPGGQAGFDKIVTEGKGFDDDFRSMTFAAYGQGHYFALDFRLADFFAEGKSQHEPKKTRRVLLCRVAAGKPFDAERLFPYVPGDPKSGRTDADWTKKMEEFNKSKPEGHDNSWIGDDRALIVGKGEMVYVDYVVEYTSTKLAGNPYVDPLMKEIKKIPRPDF